MKTELSHLYPVLLVKSPAVTDSGFAVAAAAPHDWKAQKAMKPWHTPRRCRAFRGPLLVLCALLLAGAGRASAATLVVTNRADSGPGTLREAIAIANSGDTITFAVTGTITLTSGQLWVDKHLAIRGPGASLLTICGNSSDRVFTVTNAVANISGVTIANGRAPGTGGGIQNLLGPLTVSDCVIANNTAGTNDGGGYGGGIASSSQTLIINRCTFSGNFATGNGGGLACGGGFVVTECTFSNNWAKYYGGAIYNRYSVGQVGRCTFSGNRAVHNYDWGRPHNNGGAIWNEESDLFVSQSTFSANHAENAGGAIANQRGNLSVTLSTFSGNGARSSGGAIYHVPDSLQTMSVVSCTIASNSAGTGSRGGGVYVGYVGSRAVARFRNTVLAGNAASGAPDCSGTITSDGLNFVGDATGSIGFTNGVNFDQVGDAALALNPGLGPLRDNGGPTWTHALLPGSQALDMGHSGGLSNDQRGGARTVHSTTNTPTGDGSDIGAFEAGGYVRLTSVSRSRTNSTTHLQFTKDATAAPLTVYHIQRRAALGVGDWVDLADPVGSTNTLVHFLDTTATNAQNFYRVRLISNQVWGTVVFRDDFDGPAGGPNPAAWIVNHPESWWWVQGRTFFPSPIYHPDAPFPRVGDGKCVIEHHLFNSYDNAETNVTFLGGEIRTVMEFYPSNAYRFEAKVRCNAYPNGLVTSFFTYGYDGSKSDELDFEFLSKQSNDNAQWPSGDPVLLNAWNESAWNAPRQCPQDVMVAGLDLTAWNTFRIYWYPGLRVDWTWLNPAGGETLLRTEANPCLLGLPDEPMSLFFNFWASDAGWPAAYDAALQPVNESSQNQIHTYEIDYVEVRVP